MWNGKSRGTPLGYKIFVWILNKLGVLPAYFVLRFVAVYYFFFSYKSSKAIYYYFHNRLGYSAIKSFCKIYRNYYLFGQSIIDKVVLMSGIPNNFKIEFDGEENLKKIAALNKGGLLLSAHLGNWEIAGYLFKRLNTKINIVMFDGEEQKIKEYMGSVTGEKTVNIILIKNDMSHIYEISDAFQKNEIVCMHADRFIEGNKTASIDFLGEKARFPMGPFVLAAKFKVPVSFVYSMKENSLQYHFFASPIKNYSGVDRNAVMMEMQTDYVKELENKVLHYPEQWYNYYYFWQN